VAARPDFLWKFQRWPKSPQPFGPAPAHPSFLLPLSRPSLRRPRSVQSTVVCRSPLCVSSRTKPAPHLLHFPHQDDTTPSTRLPLLLFKTTGIESSLPPATRLTRSPPRPYKRAPHPRPSPLRSSSLSSLHLLSPSASTPISAARFRSPPPLALLTTSPP
jgi:hypothetical protein